MNPSHFLRRFLFFVALVAAIGQSATAQITPPDRFLGHPIAADFTLDRWDRISAYFRHVDEASDRVALQMLGQTTERRPMFVAIVSSPETIRDLDRHRTNQRRIADP